MVHWASGPVEDIPSLVILASYLNGRFRTSEKHNAFVLFLMKLAKYRSITPLPLNTELNFDWLAGFTEGDGSFFISIFETKAMLSGYQATLNVSWTQKSKFILELISLHFQGSWAYNKVSDCWVFTIKRQSEVTRLLAIFSTHPLHGIKRLDYHDLCLANELFLSKSHLTVEGIRRLQAIRSGMNHRRISS